MIVNLRDFLPDPSFAAAEKINRIGERAPPLIKIIKAGRTKRSHSKTFPPRPGLLDM
jgi:hypothetical protein